MNNIIDLNKSLNNKCAYIYKPKCEYNPKLHFTENAKKYHFDKCVIETFQKMGNHHECVKYMSGLMMTSPETYNCNMHNIHNICKHHQKNFTINDAMTLCESETKAVEKYWKNKFNIK